MIAFVHIPKTAGTTLHKILFHQYKRTLILHDTDVYVDAALATRIREINPQVIMGHLSVGLHKHLQEIRYITCLREPISRVFSHYQHALNDPAHYLHHAVVSQNLDLASYAASGLSGELSDGMTRMLAGVSDFHNAHVDHSTLEDAKRNIENLFDAVILNNSFDAGLLMLAEEKNWSTPYYIRRKVGHYPNIRDLTTSTRATIEAHNRLDCELYSWAKQRFEKKTASFSELQSKILSFQRSNATRGKAIFCLREIKCRITNSPPPPTGRDRPMKAILLTFIRIMGRLWCQLRGVDTHPSALIHGFPRICRRPSGRIILDANVTINASSWSNPLNDGRRTVIHAAPGAIIHLHPNSGISSSRLIAFSGISIGEGTLIGAGCLICDSDMHEIPLGSKNPVATSPIHIGNHVFLGANCTVLKGVTIGDGAVVGANSLVSTNIPSGVLAVGNPARVERSQH